MIPYMIFVNTTLEVNLKETKIVIEFYQKVLFRFSHQEVNRNIGGFQGLFGGSNFMIVDNNQYQTGKSEKKI